MHLGYLSLIFFFKERNLENDLGYHVQKDWTKWPTCYNIDTLIHTLQTVSKARFSPYVPETFGKSRATRTSGVSSKTMARSTALHFLEWL